MRLRLIEAVQKVHVFQLQKPSVRYSLIVGPCQASMFSLVISLAVVMKLLVAVVLIAVCVLVRAQNTTTTCFNDRKIVLPNHGSYLLYPCGGCCYFSQNAYKYVWNYTIQSVNTDTYYVNMGDVLCQSNSWDDNFDVQVSTKYQGNFINSASRSFSPYYYSYQPTFVVRCANSIQSCQIQLSSCVTVNTVPYCFK